MIVAIHVPIRCHGNQCQISKLQEHRISTHDQLYQDANRRSARASEYEYWYPEEVTFQPAVNPPRGRVGPDANAEPVQERCGHYFILTHEWIAMLCFLRLDGSHAAVESRQVANIPPC